MNRWRLANALAWRFGHGTNSVLEGPDNVVEAVLHELCHAATFRLDALRNNSSGRSVDQDVGGVFEGYVDRHASDRAEIRALALEKRVARVLGLRYPWLSIVRSAAEDLRIRAPLRRVLRRIEYWRSDPRTKALVPKVLHWVRTALEEHKPPRFGVDQWERCDPDRLRVDARRIDEMPWSRPPCRVAPPRPRCPS